MFKYYVYKLGQFIVNRLSITAAYRFAIFLSDLHYFFSFRDRRAVRNNLRVVLQNENNLKAKTREVFRNFGKYLVEFFRIANDLDQDFIRDKVKLEGIDNLKEALARNKGGIILSAHLGNWELGAVLVSMLGYDVTAVALQHKERPVNDLFNAQRMSRGLSVIPTHLAIRRCIQTLRDNNLIAIVSDRDFGANGVKLNFLGRKTLIPKGAAMFSYRTGAPIVPSFLVRNDDDTFTFTFEKPIIPSERVKDDNISEQKLSVMIEEYAKVIERNVRKNPTQWLMFREFWTN